MQEELDKIPKEAPRKIKRLKKTSSKPREDTNKLPSDKEQKVAIEIQAKSQLRSAANVIKTWDTISGKSSPESSVLLKNIEKTNSNFADELNQIEDMTPIDDDQN